VEEVHVVSDPLEEQWRPDQVAVVHALQTWAVAHTETLQHLGRWTGLPTSDAGALAHVVWAAQDGAPISPAQLARRIGMTSGATTLLVDRLERAGLVHRSRESTDRRRVALRPSDRARELTRSFSAFAGQEVAAAVRAATPEELAVVTAFVQRMASALDAGSERLARDERVSARTRTTAGGTAGGTAAG
jgi:MarR family transcriptional regulator, organic hydroperoxide resistance regulator